MTSWSFVIYGISMVVGTVVITYCYTHKGKYTVSVVTKQLLFIRQPQLVFRHHPHISHIGSLLSSCTIDYVNSVLY